MPSHDFVQTMSFLTRSFLTECVPRSTLHLAFLRCASSAIRLMDPFVCRVLRRCGRGGADSPPRQRKQPQRATTVCLPIRGWADRGELGFGCERKLLGRCGLSASKCSACSGLGRLDLRDGLAWPTLTYPGLPWPRRTGSYCVGWAV